MTLPHAIGVALLVVLAGAAAAAAQSAAPAKPEKKPAPSIVLQIANGRAVALTELDATPTGGYIPRVIVRGLAAGKKAAARIETDKDCVYDLHGAYADGSSNESSGVDLCKDPTVKLVD